MMHGSAFPDYPAIGRFLLHAVFFLMEPVVAPRGFVVALGNLSYWWPLKTLPCPTSASCDTRHGSCRLIHTAAGGLSMHSQHTLMTASRSGLNLMTPMGVQFWVLPDQQRGLRT